MTIKPSKPKYNTQAQTHTQRHTNKRTDKHTVMMMADPQVPHRSNDCPTLTTYSCTEHLMSELSQTRGRLVRYSLLDCDHAPHLRHAKGHNQSERSDTVRCAALSAARYDQRPAVFACLIHVLIRMHACAHACIHIRIHLCMHIHMCVHTCVYACAHVCVCSTAP